MFRFSDYPAFRAAYKALRNQKAQQLIFERRWERMTSFQRVLFIAEQTKAQKRAAYTELSYKAWLDDKPKWTMIAVPGERGTRASYSGDVSSTDSVVKRPTEFLALAMAACIWSYEDSLPYADPPPIRQEKWCGWCELRLPLHAFSPDKRSSDGLHSYCKACRSELRRMKWNRGNSVT